MQSYSTPASTLKKTNSWPNLKSPNQLGTNLGLELLSTSQILHSPPETQEKPQNLQLLHERFPTTIINDVNQSYYFLQAIKEGPKLANSSLIDNSGEALISYLQSQQDKQLRDFKRASFFASTIQSRSPCVKSDGSPKQSTFNTLNSQTSANQKIRRQKNEKSWVFSDGMGRSDIGYAPSRMFCVNCNRYVGTEVKFEFKKLSFWEKLCCGVCYGSQQKGEVILHRCRYCLSLLAKIYTKDLFQYKQN